MSAPHHHALGHAAMSAGETGPPRWNRRVVIYTAVLVASLVGLSLVLLIRGLDFYALDLGARVDHPDFRILGPASPIGHGYGILGTALILTNLLYLLRRRLARARLGSMRTWLDIHVFTGLFGSVLVLFHSAFQLRTPIATLTAVSLSLVVVSGLVGRYFYGLAPAPGGALLDQGLRGLDAAIGGLGARVGQHLSRLPAPTELQRPSLLGALAMIPTWRGEASLRRGVVMAVARECEDELGLSSSQRRRLRRLARPVAKLAATDVRSVAGASLIRSWRGLHRFMALLMVLSVTVHIVTAWVFGFRWIFSE